MSDNAREGFTDKMARNLKPDSQKTTTEQFTDKAKGGYENVASSVQPNSQKSTGQQAMDSFSGNNDNRGIIDKAKDTLGLGGNNVNNN